MFLNKPPDSENPEDASKISRYDVRVKVDDGQGGSTVQDITVSIIEYNEAPVITLDGNYSSFYEHNETNLTTLFDVNATHDENKTQSIVYSIWGGADREKFQIHSTSGRLAFVTAPDYEANGSAANNNTYTRHCSGDRRRATERLRRAKHNHQRGRRLRTGGFRHSLI